MIIPDKNKPIIGEKNKNNKILIISLVCNILKIEMLLIKQYIKLIPIINPIKTYELDKEKPKYQVIRSNIIEDNKKKNYSQTIYRNNIY
ncbi:hypothetical protein ONB71_01580 [Candidatus Purcelliella pentastirinorum]|uniref:Uncharacterized protein n=1 Tax=Candidatus Purcelliella pentastirinorum TaxID=472834 RepID=A0AAX3N725_9ENTR|nr:hypothetical protein [Candidatus Purcelliella pentastirinorum]WDI78387.1 hypothetical protein ONB71_01580 [Candidatus Purcelliella pentastirinorum]WDR80587.1 hypothetical protein ONB70_00335 [Candidatus Purcelliella pentastirinorum]